MYCLGFHSSRTTAWGFRCLFGIMNALRSIRTMPKTDLQLAGDDYVPVADRILQFYERFATGRIVTHLVRRTDDEVIVRAEIFRTATERQPAATGLAAEREGDGDINTVACLENTETSAIGRALANLGLTASAHRPSREEMDKANRERIRRVAESVHESPTSARVRRGSLTSHLTRPLTAS